MIFLSGDDARADDRVTRLIERAGRTAIDLGPLATDGRLQQCPPSASSRRTGMTGSFWSLGGTVDVKLPGQAAEGRPAQLKFHHPERSNGHRPKVG